MSSWWAYVYMICGCIATHYNAVESMMVLFKLTYAKERRACIPEEFPFFVRRAPKELTAFDLGEWPSTLHISITTKS